MFLPLHLSAPENISIIFSLHSHWHESFLGLLDGIHLSGDSTQLSELDTKQHNILESAHTLTWAVLKQFGSRHSCRVSLSPGRGTVGLQEQGGMNSL